MELYPHMLLPDELSSDYRGTTTFQLHLSLFFNSNTNFNVTVASTFMYVSVFKLILVHCLEFYLFPVFCMMSNRRVYVLSIVVSHHEWPSLPTDKETDTSCCPISQKDPPHELTVVIHIITVACSIFKFQLSYMVSLSALFLCKKNQNDL